MLDLSGAAHQLCQMTCAPDAMSSLHVERRTKNFGAAFWGFSATALRVSTWRLKL